ncbi:MAG: lipase maturation factor family protein [Myxococcales bacterium]|nr:lipase maturation factor family protein [Myxococcales bacterium]
MLARVAAAFRGIEPETHLFTRRVFLTLLAVSYAAAFVSLWVQVDGLIGSGGIQPLARLLDQLASSAGGARFWRLPTLLWLGASDTALHLVCAAGVLGSGLLLAGVAPRFTAAALWILYLSLVSVGGIFLSYQWDALLLETGFLAIWLAPARLRPSDAWRAPVEPLAVWLLRFLLFKLMFLSGLVKLLSGDETWLALSAMDFHYWTQPLPSPTSWLVHHLPSGFHAFEVVATFAVELVVPFLIFLPRPWRWLAFPPIAGLQFMIFATGNYGFFNLLTLALCVPVLDDAALRRLLPDRLRPAAPDPAHARPRGWPRRRLVFAGFAGLLFALSGLRMTERLDVAEYRPDLLVTLGRAVSPFRSVNGYGLFAVMTRQRNEIALEGSRDGKTWLPYGFRYKPGPLDAAPAFAGPHMPRLDWQLWFAALRGCARASWFHAFLRQVLLGESAVLDLLAENPFPDDPPRFLRTPFASYRFAPPGGDTWWTAEPLGEFCPTVTLSDGRLVSVQI